MMLGTRLSRGAGLSVRAGAVICAAAALSAGCGSSSSSSASAPPGTALQRAAYVSSGESGYKVVTSMRVTSRGSTVGTFSGSGSFSVPTHAAALTLHLSFPSAPASAGLANAQIQMVLSSSTLYMKLPPALAGKLPGGKPWLEISLSQLGKVAGIPGLGTLFDRSSSLNNPGQYLSYLRATSNGTVQDLGSATVDGVQTTHYHAKLDLAKLPDAVPAADRAATQQLVAALKSRGASAPVPIDAWIDSAHLVRRIDVTYTQQVPGAGSVGEALQEDFVQYGPQPAPAIPPASQTQNLLALTNGRP